MSTNFKPLKAHTYEPSRIIYPCWVQPKLNGLRAVYQNGNFYSRDFERWNTPVVSHLTSVLLSLFDTKIILDGEMYVHGWLLQQINSAAGVNRLGPNERTRDVEFHVFDVVNFGTSFAQRTRETFEVLNHPTNLSGVKAVTTQYVHSAAEADRFYIQCIELGYEGIMYRLGDCSYTHPNQPGTPPENPRARSLSDQDNRVWHMLKRKDWQDDEFEIVAVLEGKETDKGSKLVGCVGALVCRNGVGVEFSCGGFEGFTHSDLRAMFLNPPIGQFATIKYLTLTEEQTPFNAHVIAIRPTRPS